jgi:hypothetical protein
MSDNEQNASNPVDEQETSEAERGDEQPVEERQEMSGVAAPADDEIIIK